MTDKNKPTQFPIANLSRAQCIGELHDAGLSITDQQTARKWTFFGWVFTRHNYYWRVKTGHRREFNRPIAEAVAREFNREWGSQVRVRGYCGGCDVTGDVYTYDIDTVEGLRAFVNIISTVVTVSAKTGLTRAGVDPFNTPGLCGGCGGELDSTGWCANYRMDDDD